MLSEPFRIMAFYDLTRPTMEGSRGQKAGGGAPGLLAHRSKISMHSTVLAGPSMREVYIRREEETSA